MTTRRKIATIIAAAGMLSTVGDDDAIVQAYGVQLTLSELREVLAALGNEHCPSHCEHGGSCSLDVDHIDDGSPHVCRTAKGVLCTWPLTEFEEAAGIANSR